MIIDTLIPDDLKEHFDILYRVRVLVAILILYSIMVTGITIWLFFFADTAALGRLIGTTILLGMQTGYIISLLLVRLKGWFTLSANITILATAAGIASGVMVSGGPMTAPAISMNILPIIMGFILIGKRAGLIWTQIILTMHVSMMITLVYGIEFIQYLEPESLPLQHLTHWIITYTAMIGLMFVFDTLNSHLKKEVTAEKQKFEHLASYDPLTNLANRMQFDINLNQTMNRSNRHNTTAALFFIDLDDFKPINDNLGHDAGDIVLQTISHRLEDNVRGMDTVARLGGDEFGIIFEDINDQTTLIPMANKILQVIAEPITINNSSVTVHGSIGIAVFPTHTTNKAELVKFADMAMYEAKKSKNQWAMFSDILKGNDYFI